MEKLKIQQCIDVFHMLIATYRNHNVICFVHVSYTNAKAFDNLESIEKCFITELMPILRRPLGEDSILFRFFGITLARVELAIVCQLCRHFFICQ